MGLVGRRSDIQFLRGVAVLLVMLCHAFPNWMPHGNLGVDVFFVISGFLMTRMIATAMDEQAFSFTGFYMRRARRLLPAAFVTFAATTVLAWMLLDAGQWPDYIAQLFGALTFTANFVTAKQFIAGSGDLHPLTHTWSLSLEEQFYLLFPLILWLVPARRWFVTLAAFALASMALCFILASGSFAQQVAAACFLPGRAWQLLAGGLVALMKRPLTVHPVAKYGALWIVIACTVVGFDSVQPRIDALLVTAATAIMLIGRDGWIRVSAIERIGDWSYSLYLVHWPLISFARLQYGAIPPVIVALALCALATVLAALQYRFVEQRWRSARVAKNLAAIEVAAAGSR